MILYSSKTIGSSRDIYCKSLFWPIIKWGTVPSYGVVETRGSVDRPYRLVISPSLNVQGLITPSKQGQTSSVWRPDGQNFAVQSLPQNLLILRCKNRMHFRLILEWFSDMFFYRKIYVWQVLRQEAGNRMKSKFSSKIESEKLFKVIFTFKLW